MGKLLSVTGNEADTLGTQPPFTVVDSAIGAVVGKVIPVKASGITAGRNSMEAVFKSGLTKLGNQTASKMSAKVIGKGIASGFTSDLGIAAGMGVKSFLENSWERYYQQQESTPTGPYYWCAP